MIVIIEVIIEEVGKKFEASLFLVIGRSW